MGLIEVVRFVDRVENRRSLFQKGRCISRPLDLGDRPAGDADRAQKMTLSRSDVDAFGLTPQYGRNPRVTDNDALSREPGNEGLRIIEVGVIPRRPIQPE